MTQGETDFSLSLEELSGLREGDSADAATPMVAEIRRSWKKPLNQLTDNEIGSLVVQHYGHPYLLDLVWPKLETDPLFDGGNYPGDVLSNLIRADAAIWAERPAYQSRLQILYRRALAESAKASDAFRESLGLPESTSEH